MAKVMIKIIEEVGPGKLFGMTMLLI